MAAKAQRIKNYTNSSRWCSLRYYCSYYCRHC